MEEIFKKYSLLKDQNVPRETLIEFELFISMLQQVNAEINIISKKTAKNELIRERHIIDSAQIIEFVDLNSNIITDIGSG
ncbi:class I SAM-dependent methyltransferase, partial [Candidatus Pelagibacter sp.]|nr:class I SAM-dependent methyltransferase [Candidatus Pelagibacter sp.]